MAESSAPPQEEQQESSVGRAPAERKVLRSCDICRKRKIKCLPKEGAPPPFDSTGQYAICINCDRLSLACSYTHQYKKAGGRRSTTSKQATAQASTDEHTGNAEASTSASVQTSESVSAMQPQPSTAPPQATRLPPPAPQMPFQEHGHFLNESYQLAPLAQDAVSGFPPPPVKNGLYDSSEAQHLDDLAWTLSQHISPNGLSADGSTPHMPDGAALPLPPIDPGGGGGGQQSQQQQQQVFRRPGSSSEDGVAKDSPYRGSTKFYKAINPQELQVEDVASWSMIGRIIALYLRYMHTLFPLVHAPTFSQDLMMRRDLHDRQFRAFVLGLVSYIIGQSPLNRLLQLCSRSDLARLQKNCHAASMTLHDRQYTQPGLLHVGTLITGYFYSASVGLSQKAGALLAEACELVHALQLGEPNGVPQEVTDFRELNTRRRVYYHVYAVDATEAAAGRPLHFHEYDVHPPLPSDLSDDNIIAQGAFPDPSKTKLSPMSGFVACMQVFLYASQCMTKHRQFRHSRLHYGLQQLQAALQWAIDTEAGLENMLAGLPPALMAENPLEVSDLTEDEISVWGMVRANLSITICSTRMALYAFRLDLFPDDVASIRQRDIVCKEAYRALSSLHPDDLAANGESMRGKIFRILLALLESQAPDQLWGDTLQEWWNMYSRIQYVQFVPFSSESLFPSREASPQL